MSMQDNVIVRMEIDGLGRRLTAAFIEHADEVKEIAKQEVEAAITRFDLRKLVKDEAERQLHKLVRDAVGTRFASHEVYQKLREIADIMCGQVYK